MANPRHVAAALLLTLLATPLWAEDGEVTPEQIERMVRDKQDEGTPEGDARRAEEALLKELREKQHKQTVGDSLPAIDAFRVDQVLADPNLFNGQTVKITGRVRRECQTGCWVEIARYPSDKTGIRVVPGREWKFPTGDRSRVITAFGVLKKRALDKKAARTVDGEAGEKSRGARTEWVLVAEGAEITWLP